MGKFGKGVEGNLVTSADLEAAGVVVKPAEPLIEAASQIFEKNEETKALSNEYEVDRLKALRNFLVTIGLIK